MDKTFCGRADTIRNVHTSIESTPCPRGRPPSVSWLLQPRQRSRLLVRGL